MRIVARCAAAAIAACLVGCTTGPNGPSSTAASITGTVRTASAAASGASSVAANQMKVTVSGTSVATMTNSGGQFTLNDVPAGIVTLVFEGAGANARLPLGDVRAGDRIRIVVTVNGSRASLDSRQDEDDDEDEDEDENEVEGRISGLGGSCPNRTFNVGSTAVKTSANTKFEGVRCDALANDMKVEAEGTFANGVLNATKIERE